MFLVEGPNVCTQHTRFIQFIIDGHESDPWMGDNASIDDESGVCETPNDSGYLCLLNGW